MSEYCDSAATPTADFSLYLASASPTFNKAEYNEKHTAVTFSDPMGDATKVSLYYTPSLTGSAAWHTTLSTIEGWANYAIRTTRADTADTTSSPIQSTTDSSEADATTGTADTTSYPTQSATDSFAADAMHSGGYKNGALAVFGVASLMVMVAAL